MKTLLRITLGLMLTTVVIASCDDDDDDNRTTEQKLQNRWLVDSISYRTVTGVTESIIVQPGTATDYYDFRSDGNLYYKLGMAEPDTVSYNIINDEQVVVDGDTAAIETLTENRLIGSTKIQLSPTSYNVVKSYLRR